MKSHFKGWSWYDLFAECFEDVVTEDPYEVVEDGDVSYCPIMQIGGGIKINIATAH